MTTIFFVTGAGQSRDETAQALELAGHFVFIMNSSQEALAMLDTIIPDVVLFDWLLSGMPGDVFVDRCHSRAGLSGLPIIVMTSIPIIAPRSTRKVIRTPVSVTTVIDSIQEVLVPSKLFGDARV